MKTWFWIVLAAFVVLAGYLVWYRTQPAKLQTNQPPVAFEVGAESAAVYEQRVAELEARVEVMKERMKATGTTERRAVKARLAEFERQISELKHLLARLRVARGGDASNDAYHACLFLYGKARGVCEALVPDTLVGK